MECQTERKGKDLGLHIYFFAFVILVSGWSYSFAKDANVIIGKFIPEDCETWQEKKFEGLTSYSCIEDEEKGWIVKAESAGSASGLYKEVTVDLTRTPWLNWSWKVETPPVVGDEKTKSGDDYPARLYIIFKTGPWFWNTKALNYVWSSKYPVGESWPNAFTSNAIMLAVQSGKSMIGRWVEERQNVRLDIFKYFGIEVENIEAVAIMTDTDNSQGKALTYYGEIYFSSE